VIVRDLDDLDCGDGIDVNPPVLPYRDRGVVRSEDQPVRIPEIDGELPTSATCQLMTADRHRMRHLAEVIRIGEQLKPQRDDVGQLTETTFEFLVTVAEPLQPARAKPNLQQICPVERTITQEVTILSKKVKGLYLSIACPSHPAMTRCGRQCGAADERFGAAYAYVR